MSRPVSLVVWRDAKTDPPKGDMSRQVLVAHHDPSHDRFWFWVPTMHAVAVARDRGRTIRFWAERPVVSDLTDDDVRWATDALAIRGAWSVVEAEQKSEAIDRLRAALGGEKEEGDA